MNWKQFLKPDWKKIVIFVVLIFIGVYFGFLFNIAVSAAIPKDRAYCIDLQAETLNSNIFTYILIPFTTLLYGTICEKITLILINLPYLYLISCLIIWIYYKIKNEMLIL